MWMSLGGCRRMDVAGWMSPDEHLQNTSATIQAQQYKHDAQASELTQSNALPAHSLARRACRLLFAARF